MSVTVILGMQWGDEGKGKVIDYLARRYDFVARFNGGNNAGHTVVNPLGEFKIHLVPSGIFYPHTRCLMGGGMVMDPARLGHDLYMFYIVGYVWVCQRLYIGSYLGLYIVGGKILYCGERL